jgi:hypothetical protein
MTKRVDDQDRKQQQLRRLGTQNPICVVCGEADPAVLERHHVAGRKHDDDLATVCANCHKKLSNKQHGHVSQAPTEPMGQLAKIGYYLLGLADLFAMIVEALRKFGACLIRQSRGAVTP